MSMTRNLCCKCPHYYEQHGYECDDVDWGCTAFGREFENCPSFDDGEGNADFEEWGCNESIKRINFKLNRIKKRDRAYWKSQKRIAFKYKVHTDTIKTESGYKVFGCTGNFIGYSSDYMPKMKGGHTHNHVKNMELRLMLTKKEIKALRKIMKMEKKNGRN